MYQPKDTGYSQTFLARYGKDTYTDYSLVACEMAQYITELFLCGLGDEEPGMFIEKTPELQRRILQEVSEIIEDCDAEAATLCATVISDVLRVMDGLDEHTAGVFAKVICQLSCSRESAEVLRETRAVELVLGSMEQFPTNEAVQREGCWAIYCLTGRTTPWRRWQDQASELGALELLLAALRNHPLSSPVQANGSAAVGNLVFKHPANQAALVGLEGLETLVLALRGPSCNDSVLTFGLFWMINLASASQEYAEALADLGAASVLIGILSNQPGNCPIATNACLAMQALAQCSGAAQLLLEEGAVAAVVLAMNAHSGCTHLGSGGVSRAALKEGTRALLALAQSGLLESLQNDKVRLLMDLVSKKLAGKDDQAADLAQSVLQAVF